MDAGEVAGLGGLPEDQSRGTDLARLESRARLPGGMAIAAGMAAGVTGGVPGRSAAGITVSAGVPVAWVWVVGIHSTVCNLKAGKGFIGRGRQLRYYSPVCFR